MPRDGDRVRLPAPGCLSITPAIGGVHPDQPSRRLPRCGKGHPCEGPRFCRENRRGEKRDGGRRRGGGGARGSLRKIPAVLAGLLVKVERARPPPPPPACVPDLLSERGRELASLGPGDHALPRPSGAPLVCSCPVSPRRFRGPWPVSLLLRRLSATHTVGHEGGIGAGGAQALSSVPSASRRGLVHPAARGGVSAAPGTNHTPSALSPEGVARRAGSSDLGDMLPAALSVFPSPPLPSPRVRGRTAE